MAPLVGAPATSTQSPFMGSSLPGSTSPAVDGFASCVSDRGGAGAVSPACRSVDPIEDGEWRMNLPLMGNNRDRDGHGWGRRGSWEKSIEGEQ
jgi:hypothetical protein